MKRKRKAVDSEEETEIVPNSFSNDLLCVTTFFSTRGKENPGAVVWYPGSAANMVVLRRLEREDFGFFSGSLQGSFFYISHCFY